MSTQYWVQHNKPGHICVTRASKLTGASADMFSAAFREAYRITQEAILHGMLNNNFASLPLTMEQTITLENNDGSTYVRIDTYIPMGVIAE